MNKRLAVVFDLDDTLYSERSFAMSGFAAVAKAYAEIFDDPNQTEADMQRLFAGGFRNRVFNTLMKERNLPEDAELVQRMVLTYRSHVPSISLHPDGDAAISRLGAAHKLGLITDGPALMQNNKLDALALRNRIDFIVVTDELGPGGSKPNTLAFQMVATELATEHKDCVYIADNPKKDFVGPNKLGWTTVRVIRPDGIYRDESPPVGGAPRHSIESLDDLDRLLPTLS